MNNDYLDEELCYSYDGEKPKNKKNYVFIVQMIILAIGLALEIIAGIMYNKTINDSERMYCTVPITYIEQIDPGRHGGVVRYSLHYDHPITKADMHRTTTAMNWKPGQTMHVSVYVNPKKAAVNTIYGLCLFFIPMLCVIIAIPADRIFFKNKEY